MDSASCTQSPSLSVTVSSSRAPHCKTCKLPRKGHPRTGCPSLDNPDPEHQLRRKPSTAPPRIGTVAKRGQKISKIPSVSISSIQEDPETFDNSIAQPLPDGTASETRHCLLAQDLGTLLSAYRLSLTELQNRGADKWEVLVTGTGSDIDKWIATTKQSNISEERSATHGIDTQRCWSPLHAQEKLSSHFSVFMKGVLCGIIITLAVLMYFPDDTSDFTVQ